MHADSIVLKLEDCRETLSAAELLWLLFESTAKPLPSPEERWESSDKQCISPAGLPLPIVKWVSEGELLPPSVE